MFAVIETGGKQYIATLGAKLRVEKLDIEEGKAVSFDKVLFRENESGVEIGKPYISGAKVGAKVLSNGRDDKKIVFKFHSKNRFDKKKTHRQHFTEVEITEI